MRSAVPLVVLTLLLALAPRAAEAQRKGRIIEVRMGEMYYKPDTIRAKPGDVLRFVQEGEKSHNVEFKLKGAPAGVDLGTLRKGTYVKRVGDYYDVPIDARFSRSGNYPFICTPHKTMGMVGLLIVER